MSLFLWGLISLTLKSGLQLDVEVGRKEDKCLFLWGTNESDPEILSSTGHGGGEETNRRVMSLDSRSSHTPCVISVCLALDVRRGGKKTCLSLRERR